MTRLTIISYNTDFNIFKAGNIGGIALPNVNHFWSNFESLWQTLSMPCLTVKLTSAWSC